ncbi:MAG: chemotaxis protein CheX [Phycisphaeraceae bacterium]|nr:MAG: chemotaxis protein CheX [Phycisphaeraceae bacterium]
MDAGYITPFMQSTQNVFATMLQLQVQIGEPRVKTDRAASYDISGIIGMSGDVTGSVVLSFPTETAERVVSLFTGEEITKAHDDFADAVGELVNMIAGGAKGRFKDRKVSISCPSVVVGKDHVVSTQKDVPCIAIPCETDCGQFVIEISIQDRKPNETADAAAAASA